MSLINYNAGLALFCNAVDRFGIREYHGTATTYTESLQEELKIRPNHGLNPTEAYNLIEIAQAFDELDDCEEWHELSSDYDKLADFFDEHQYIHIH